MMDANPATRLSVIEARDRLAAIIHNTPPAALLVEPLITISKEYVSL